MTYTQRTGHNPYRMSFGPAVAICGDCGETWTLGDQGWQKERFDEGPPRRPAPATPTYPEELF